jgi:hypothetical protein
MLASDSVITINQALKANAALILICLMFIGSQRRQVVLGMDLDVSLSIYL